MQPTSRSKDRKQRVSKLGKKRIRVLRQNSSRRGSWEGKCIHKDTYAERNMEGMVGRGGKKISLFFLSQYKYEAKIGEDESLPSPNHPRRRGAKRVEGHSFPRFLQDGMWGWMIESSKTNEYPSEIV